MPLLKKFIKRSDSYFVPFAFLVWHCEMIASPSVADGGSAPLADGRGAPLLGQGAWVEGASAVSPKVLKMETYQ